MTTKQYFYTDVLAASWMAKQFGMRFGYQDANGRPPPPGVHAYLHPDSLPQLVPQVGDILRLYFFSPDQDDAAGAVMSAVYAGGREAVTWFRNPRDGSIDKELHKIDDHQWRIIQRGGLAFMWPDGEPA